MSAIVCPQCSKLVQLEPLVLTGPLNTKKGTPVRLYRCPSCKVSLVLSAVEYAKALKECDDTLRAEKFLKS